MLADVELGVNLMELPGFQLEDAREINDFIGEFPRGENDPPLAGIALLQSMAQLNESIREFNTQFVDATTRIANNEHYIANVRTVQLLVNGQLDGCITSLGLLLMTILRFRECVPCAQWLIDNRNLFASIRDELTENVNEFFVNDLDLRQSLGHLQTLINDIDVFAQPLRLANAEPLPNAPETQSWFNSRLFGNGLMCAGALFAAGALAGGAIAFFAFTVSLPVILPVFLPVAGVGVGVFAIGGVVSFFAPPEHEAPPALQAELNV